MLTEKEKIIYEFIKENQHKYPYGFYAEQIPEILGWDTSVRYPDRKYRLPSYSIMGRLVRKNLIYRVYDFDTKKHLGYKLK